jgi:hypothetical protein
MIPKQLFFIWFGDNKPNYVDFAIKNFKNVNPDFNIELIYEKDPFKSNNKDIKECIELQNNLYFNFINRNFCKRHFFDCKNMILSDCFRFYLLKKYGGIYLDCDTFPNKPFDDELLNNKAFTCSFVVNNHADIYFMGSIKNIDILNYNNKHEDEIVFNDFVKYLKCIIKPDILLNNKEFMILHELFFKQEIKYGQKFSENYIEHYFSGKWRNLDFNYIN